MYDKNNVFYKILQSEIPCQKIFENDIVMAFHDINPVCEIHALVITKNLYRNFSEFALQAPDAELREFSKTIVKITEILKISETGYRLLTNAGADSGQEIEHFHVHILGGKNLAKALI